MKVVLSAVLLILITSLNAQVTKKVCFLGNSYTYYQDLPSLIDSLANHDGNDLIKDQHTPGGHKLSQHVTNATSISKVSSNEWDYVVLQDQSQNPSFPDAQVETEVYPHAKKLSDTARYFNECSTPLFFCTWGRENGDPQWEPISTFEGMNNRLYNAYAYMAEENNGKLSPVGIGFRHIYDDENAVVAHTELYADAGGHPTLKGQYLSACVFYNVIFETTPVGNSFLPSGLNQAEADYLQDVAYHVVNEIDSVEVNYMEWQANFEESRVGLTSTFSNTSVGGNTYLWDFGDGTTSTEENPTHTYPANNIYEVTLKITTVNLCEVQKTITLNFGDVGTYANGNLELLNVYPNPSTGLVNVQTYNENIKIEVFELDGKLIKSIVTVDELTRINLNSGVYIVRVGESFKKIVVL
jgi:hypothetical protein